MDYKVTDTELTNVANAIRTKGGTSAPLEWDGGFVSAINAIPTGSSTYAFIGVLYDVGEICTCSDGITTLTASDTSGSFVFAVPNAGAWTVVAGQNSTTVTVSSYGESLNVKIVTLPDIVPFATGTDEQIVAMIQAAHNNILDLQTDGGWAVGDVRTITVNAFTAEGRSVPTQNIDIVITSFDEYMSCDNVMQFDFKDELSTAMPENSQATNVGGYGSTTMKTVILPALVNALPTWLKDALIEFSVLASAGNKSTTVETITGNKLALRSVVEVFGTPEPPSVIEGTYISYYASNTQRTKTLGHNGNATKWWLRSPYLSNTTDYYSAYTNGTKWYDSASTNCGCAPFGCL